MIKIIYSTIVTICILSITLFAQDKQDEIIAVWEADETKIEIYKVDERYIGNPINSDGERILEIEVLNLEFEKDKWVGKIYSKKRDRLLNVECEVKGDKLLVKVKARFGSRTLEWPKVK